MCDSGSKTELENDCLNRLKVKIKENPRLDNFTEIFDDKLLLHFIRGKKYHEEIAYRTLVNYIKVRRDKFPALFQTLKPSTVQSLNEGIIHTLKYQVQGNPVVLCQFGEWDTQKYPTVDIMKKWILVLEELWNFNDVEIDGVNIIIDLNKVGLQHVRAFSPSYVKDIVDILWNNFPLKYKAVFIVNWYYVLKIVLKLISSILPQKLRDRLFVHGSDLSSLHRYISPDTLPKSLGGQMESDECEFQDEQMLDNLLKKEEYYKLFSEKLLLQ